jgi:hypothetical protein
MSSWSSWAFRVAWAALALTVAPALGDALADRSAPVQVTAAIGAWLLWGVVIAATFVPTTVSLTVVRCIVPLAPVVAVVAWTAGAPHWSGALAFTTASVATALAFSPAFGQALIQGSAYGDERRIPLRVPAPYLLVVPLAWVIAAACVVTGPLLIAAGQWLLGVPLAAAGVALALIVGPRFHRLARRWLVVVPAGVVIHDHVVLAETALFRRVDVAGAGLALAGTGAADLTGTTLGPAVEITLRSEGTVVLAAPPRGATRALHVRSFLVSPTRPGVALRTLADHGISVG